MVQLQVTSVKADNLSRARRLVKEAAGQGSKLVLLPVRRRAQGAGRTGEAVTGQRCISAVNLLLSHLSGMLQLSIWNQLLLLVR